MPEDSYGVLILHGSTWRMIKFILPYLSVTKEVFKNIQKKMSKIMNWNTWVSY